MVDLTVLLYQRTAGNNVTVEKPSTLLFVTIKYTTTAIRV